MEARCTKCAKLVLGKLMRYHMQYAHKEIVINYACAHNSCNRTFTNWNCLRNHYRKLHMELTKKNNTLNQNKKSNNTNKNKKGDIAEYEELSTTVSSTPSTESNIKGNEKASFYETALKIAAELYGDTKLSRTQAEAMVSLFNKVVNNDFVESLKELVMKYIDKSVEPEVQTLFNDFQSSFSQINTQHKFLAELRNRNCVIDCESVVYGYREEPYLNSIKHVKNNGCIIRLSRTLTKFFEIHSVLEKTLDYLENLRSEINISNIMQTEFWKAKSARDDEMVLPLFLYQDDFESGNPLGSHATLYKMSGMYISLPFLPPEYRSKLDTIFLFQIAHSVDVREYSSQVVYGQVINELNYLATKGINVNINGKIITILFKLAMIIGDNLGLNSILGFTESFNADFFCRFCKVKKKSSTAMCTEDNSLLRNKQNYDVDVLKNDVRNTGIKERCVWNDVIDFHVMDNFCVDIMHDLFEGVCNYDMGLILHQLINVQKMFTLDALNFKIKYFRYSDNDNKPPFITLNQLQNGHLKMSAAEMKCFILNGTLMFGDLISKVTNFWKLYLLLRQIVSIALQSIISPSDIETLKKLIENHHKLYVKLFRNTLKPKHHNMLHYPRVIQAIGPLRHIWSMRFEAKHRSLKQIALTSNNRRNLPYTIAFKQQLHMSKLFLNNDLF